MKFGLGVAVGLAFVGVAWLVRRINRFDEQETESAG